MPPVTRCPDARDLQRLLLGDVADDEAEALERHLHDCPACLRIVRATEANDTLVEALRGQRIETDADDTLQSVVGRLIVRVQEMCPPAPALPETGAAPPEDAPRDLLGLLAPAQGPDELGRLGPYRVLKVLGAGGMGVVFQAEDPELKRLVALKVMKPALAASATAQQRFLREARATAAIKHDHIVTIYQVGQSGGVPFLAMEYLEGECLAERLKREGTLPVAEVLRIGREIAAGLSAAHARGLIHRDVKPGNVWLETLPGERGRQLLVLASGGR
jgi:hypothetical protein